jgi:cystathionine beta-lyase/cystathionine gamma-synthase
MAAIACALTALCGSGGRVVASHFLYGATVRLLTGELARFGVETTWVDTTDLNAVEAALRPRADVLLVETAANPLLQIADLPSMARLCRASGAKLVVDNTFASPLGCRPLEQGADISLHSVTKFLSGHSDLTLGAAAGRKELIDQLRVQARLWGGAANPFEAWLALRGIATFPLRMERSCQNALELARRLEAHPTVARVYYPGLPSHPQHELAARVLDNFGAMLAFDTGSGEAARSVLRRLQHVRFAPSLGDTATTVSYPAATSHRALTAEQRAELGITDGVIRLSVGIDHVDDVWADLEQALAGA